MSGNRQIGIVLIATAVLFAMYFPVALWIKYSPPELTDVPGQKIRLYGIFRQREGFAFIARSPHLNGLWDSVDDPQTSPVMLYEDYTPLGPAHSAHDDIAALGRGLFSHWKGYGVVFATSDNTDPNTNGRTYWAVVPPQANPQ